MRKKELEKLLTEITAIKAETKMHLKLIEGCGSVRLSLRLERRLTNLDGLKSAIISAAIVQNSAGGETSVKEGKEISLNL